MKKLEYFIEALIFSSRWMLVPFYLGLVACIALLLVKFSKEFIGFIFTVFSGSGSDVVIGVLTLIDVVMIANLLLIIIFAGYENFVSKIDVRDSEDKPSWMGKVGFSDLKMKMMGTIIAISAIELLKAFLTVESLSNEELAWQVGIHMTFVVSALLFAASDWLTAKKKN
ncbi:MAG TPA: TIGR00645 family protein [Gammaproteobacteria bacterium]|nr:TIGR00645 family protein [Gammaproteobacteria bacterium]